MARRKWFVVTVASLLALVLGGVGIHWWFNGNTRPFDAQNVLRSVHGESGEGTFANGIVFVSPPVVKLNSRNDSNEALKTTIIVETTATGFNWKNIGDSEKSDGTLDVHAHGRISKEEAERLGLRWFPFSWLQLW